MARKRWKLAVALVAALGVVAMLPCTLDLLAWSGSPIRKLMIKVPRTRDARLVGTWRGTWRFLDEPNLRPKVTEFRSEGTGWFSLGEYHYPFEWGTEDGVLYTRRMATDSWSARHFRYGFSTDQKTVQFVGAGPMFDLVCAEMHRQ
jgi:hypothetical protein